MTINNFLNDGMNMSLGADYLAATRLLVRSSYDKNTMSVVNDGTGSGVSGYSSGGAGVEGSTGSDFGAGVSGDGPVGIRGRGVKGVGDSGGTGVMGESAPGGIGVYGVGVGDGSVGVIGGVDGNGSVAVQAVNQTNNGLGFSQIGSNGRNNLEGTLSIGYTAQNLPTPTTGVKIQVDGGVKILPVTNTIPNCQLSNRAIFWFTKGTAAGVADSAQVCAKNADGTYSWKNLF
jgi:hypothetical protein